VVVVQLIDQNDLGLELAGPAGYQEWTVSAAAHGIKRGPAELWWTRDRVGVLYPAVFPDACLHDHGALDAKKAGVRGILRAGGGHDAVRQNYRRDVGRTGRGSTDVTRRGRARSICDGCGADRRGTHGCDLLLVRLRGRLLRMKDLDARWLGRVGLTRPCNTIRGSRIFRRGSYVSGGRRGSG
jgi:hypothetical protein